MLNHLDGLTARVGGNNPLIDSWLTARRQLLVAYYQAVGLKPAKSSLTTLDDKAMDAFCQNLVDYLSTGHFSIYQRLIDQIQNSHPLSSAGQICQPLESNTDTLMRLYDSHLAQAITDDNCLEFQQALSEVGETLEARFTLEDALIMLAYEQNQHPHGAANDSQIDRPA
ncbi:Rsd/AlgQ family anti-sigma factor [Pantoea sp. 1.19]|uniref:Rsd/AlgQ family anti-sigma factor n=1 Tax=Pantoea sp. 1.19 TaxID=1925589 RepID=UPI000948AA37|nr:Rsd/AlgQ family anti-sigma factor [Pantoea sp. 1.19]